MDLASSHAKDILGSCGMCHLSLQITTFQAASVLFIYFIFILLLCCGLHGVQGVHCTDNVTYGCRKPTKDPQTKYSTAFVKLVWMDALSVVASLFLVDLGGVFACLAAGQRSLLHCVSRAVISMCEGRGGTWVSASQHSGTGRHSIAFVPDVTGKHLGKVLFLLLV